MNSEIKTQAAAGGNKLIHTYIGGTSVFSDFFWSIPQLMETREVGESVEMIYKQTSNVTLTVYPPRPPQERVFKIVYSCRDGKWHKSEPVFGKIIPAQSEYYVFEQN